MQNSNLLIIALIVIIILLIARRGKSNKTKQSTRSSANSTRQNEIQAEFNRINKEDTQKRIKLYKGQRPNEPDYGYQPTNPIMTSTIWDTDKYLDKLRTLDGRSFTWERTGSICMSTLYDVKDVMVDTYQLFLDGKKYKEIFICPYGHQGDYVPQGMKLSS